MSLQTSFRVGKWMVHPALGIVTHEEEEMHLEPRAMQVLIYLAEHAGDVVSRETLLDKVWKESFVSDESLTTAVRKIRRVLGDDPKKPRFIQTIPQQGYRLIETVVEEPGGGEVREHNLYPGPAPCNEGDADRLLAREEEIDVLRARVGSLRLLILIGTSAAVLIIMGSLFYARRDRVLTPSSPPLPPPRVVPVTSYPGVESYPAISPDGSRVAFLMHDDVYVQNTSGGNALQLTDTSADEISVTWTPDSQRITFLRSIETGHEIYSIPALGGAETRITRFGSLTRNVFGLSWSPDGKNLAYVDSDTPGAPQSIFLLDTETGDKTRLTHPPPESIGDLYPVFSPGGDRIAFVRMETTHIVRDIYTKNLKGGNEVRLTTEGGTLEIGFDWSSDGRSIIYSIHGGLYRIAASGGEPLSVVGMEGRAGWLSVSRIGTFLVVEQSLNDWNIWRAPGSRSQSGEPKRFFGSTRMEHTPVYSRDGTRIAFVSNRTGSPEIWICDSHGASPMRLTSFEEYADRPSWSPDGEEIVFDASREGQTDVYRVSAAGGVPLRLTNEPSVDAGASWSRNGEWIYFISDRSGSRQIWKMTAAGEKATQLSQNGGWQPTESFDGAFVYFSKTEGGDGIWRLPSSGGDEEPVLDGVYPHRWSLTEDGIAYINEVTQEFELFDFASGKRTHFSSPTGPLFPRGGGVSLSPDGRWLIYPQNDAAGIDLVMLENFR